MKEIITKVLLIAIALSAFTYFVVTGLWTDSKTTDGRKDAEVMRSVIPQS
ncbi:hypothetical protein [Paenibacillus abyssi]|uniref:Uncharacterized protein n=1 Tax=Paenibacillus abyssi TaxID=1340531 RepID=A0A917G2P0_9BACL|nr:hypothetical protein [Paenibacillus abyssi]GGG18813.1 hypothetical protein GCM10010916_39530 [Paenibacillus abyssi]